MSAPVQALAADLKADDFQKLSARVDKLETDALVRAAVETEETVAFLKPTGQEFHPLRTSIGYITVNIVNVSDYANGSQVVLQFGNPTAAVLNTPKATIEWGRLDANGLATGQTYSKQQDFLEATPAGSWKRYTVNLEGVPSKELGYVRLKDVESKSISLRQAY